MSVASGSSPDHHTDDETIRLEFHYLKSNYFRVVKVDGAFGGIGPDGSIQMNLYSERLPIPDVTVSLLSRDGVVSGELQDERVIRNGIVREIETHAVMTPDVARALIAWLEDKVGKLETHTKDAPS